MCSLLRVAPADESPPLEGSWLYGRLMMCRHIIHQEIEIETALCYLKFQTGLYSSKTLGMQQHGQAMKF